ncbi:MAG: hypothetical protein IPM34_06895 [Saprospiraceae bacterium]|nr:hypothetical protein [Saprospiraceae bacterium]
MTDSSKTIIVNYHPGLDEYNSSGNKDFVNAKYLNFLQALESKKNVSPYFFYKSPEGTERFDKRIKWYPDIKEHIERHYFPRHYPCGSYLIVYPNRTYFLYKGEYDILEILKQI